MTHARAVRGPAVRRIPPAAPRPRAPVTVREDVIAPFPFRLRGGSMDGLFVRKGSAVQRLVHVGDVPVFCGVVQDRGVVRFAARSACGDAAAEGVRRLRFAVGVDEDHREFCARFRDDPYIGRAVRAVPELRVRRRPDPWEALAWAITEQLIEYSRACQIQRRMIAALGRRCAETGLRDAPSAAAVAGESPARLASFDLAPHRVLTLRRAAIEVARGRIDFADFDATWKRLARVSGIGPWTLEILALQGQGRYDQVPAGDLGYIKLVGRVLTGRPKARAEIDDVRAFFERYGEWQGLAGEYLRLAAARGWLA